VPDEIALVAEARPGVVMDSAKLTGLRLLVVEDEAIVAMLIEDQLANLGCVVVGLAGSVFKSLAMLNENAAILDGAMLDVNLGGEKVYPVAEELTKRRIPFLFSTGYGRAGIQENFSQIPILTKPYSMSALEEILVRVFKRPSGPKQETLKQAAIEKAEPISGDDDPLTPA
jgi:CheY-like chemotaxis protein